MTLAAYYSSVATNKRTKLADLKGSILGPTNTITGKTTYYLMYPLALAALCRIGGLAAGSFVRALGASPQTATAGTAFLNAFERAAATKGGGPLMAAFSKVLPEITVAGKAIFQYSSLQFINLILNQQTKKFLMILTSLQRLKTLFKLKILLLKKLTIF